MGRIRMSEVSKQQFIQEMSALYQKIEQNPKNEEQIIETYLKEKIENYTFDDLWHTKEAMRLSKIIMEERS